MGIYAVGNNVHVSVNNLPEFKRLLDQAKKEAEQLNGTIRQLSCFELEFSFSVVEGQAGAMDLQSGGLRVPGKSDGFCILPE